MFCMFYVFAGVLNVLPFRVKDISANVTEFQISLLYLGYGMGILVSLFSKRIIKLFKSEHNTIMYSLLFFCFIACFLLTTNLIALFIMLFLFCIGMFTIHTVSTGLANSMKSSQKALTSGMYLSFYYFGGASGSFIPSIIYEKFGWDMMIYSFIGILILIFFIVVKAKNLFLKKG